MEIYGRVPMCGRVVTSLRIAASDSRGTSVRATRCDQSAYCNVRRSGYRRVAWRVTGLHIATSVTVGYQCVTCCDQSAYCNI